VSESWHSETDRGIFFHLLIAQVNTAEVDHCASHNVNSTIFKEKKKYHSDCKRKHRYI